MEGRGNPPAVSDAGQCSRQFTGSQHPEGILLVNRNQGQCGEFICDNRRQ